MWILTARCNSQVRLDGKTAVVTGCNTGIGKETVLEFVKRGGRVIMACRDMAKAQIAADDIRKKTEGLQGVGEVVVIRLDLASLASVRECAQHLLRTEPRIDLLVNNAGVMFCPKSLTEDGFETHFGVNHLGHFLFTLLLLPRILRSAPARIINVASHMHWFGSINFNDLQWERTYSPVSAYARSKLANVMFTCELAERLKGTEVTTYSVHPGVVSTELGRHLDSAIIRGSYWVYNKILNYFMKTPEQGSQTTLHCSLNESLSKESGLYYSECGKMFKRTSGGPENAKKLWQVSEKLIGLGNCDPFTDPDNAWQETSSSNLS